MATKGPWSVEKLPGGPYRVVSVPAARWPGSAFDNLWVAEVTGSDHAREDACLLAAAPSMREALKKVRHLMETSNPSKGFQTDVFLAVCAALREADGK